MFAKVMRFYGLGFKETLKLPLSAFWFLLRQIDRLNAEDDLRLIRVAASASSSEAYQSATDHFEKQIGDVVVYNEVPREMKVDEKTGLDPAFDRSGLRELKALTGS